MSNPRSTNSAPRETKPSGTFKTPDAIPAKNPLKNPGDLSLSCSSISSRGLSPKGLTFRSTGLSPKGLTAMRFYPFV